MDVIETVKITDAAGRDAFKTRWGSTVYDYKLNNTMQALQDLMVLISTHRANAVEGEVEPLSVRIRNRNAKLEKLGTVLSELTKVQSSFKSDDKGSTEMGGWLTFATGEVLEQYVAELGIGDDFRKDSEKGYKTNKMCIDAFVEKIKNVIDGLNNQSQSDMTRLQALVDRRDESYTTASSLMSAISDTRDNAIRNI